MPKAKPVSLHPLSFEEAIKALTHVVRAHAEFKPRRANGKQKRKPKTKLTT